MALRKKDLRCRRSGRCFNRRHVFRSRPGAVSILEEAYETFSSPRVGVEPGIFPCRELAAWLSNKPILDQGISGQSLRYFRSGLPVAVFEVSASDFASLASRADAGEFPEIHRHSRSDHEMKWMLTLPDLTDEFHCLIRTGKPPERALRISLDDLRYDSPNRKWTGTDAALKDLADGRISILAPDQLSADHVIQAAVLAAMLDFAWDDSTRDRARSAFRLEDAEKIGRKFLGKAFRKIVTGAKPSRGFLALDEIGALSWFFPELAAGKGLAQNRYHSYDIFFHSLYACDAVQGPDLPIRLAALFHDLGKVDTRKEKGDGEASFHNHELVSTRHADKVLRRFGFEPWLVKRVKFLVRNHMFHYTGEWTDRAVRRFMNKVSPELLSDLITLRLADRKGSGKRTALPRAVKDMIRHIHEVRARDAELKVKDLAIDGHTLMEMGLPAGPDMGRILRVILDRVKAEELPNDKEELRKAALSMFPAREEVRV